jgi:O-antigen/teichoic acid export membrane protein
VTRVAFPWLSRIQEDSEKVSSTYLKIIGLVTAVNAPILVALAVLADWYVPLLLGEGWDTAIVLIQILAGYALLRSVINAGGSVILAKGRADWTFYWNLFLLLLYPGALYLAARLGDLRTLALVLASLQIPVLFLYHRALIQPLTGIGLVRFLSAIGRPMLCAAVAGLLAYVVAFSMDQAGNLTRVVAGGITGAGVYAMLAYFLIPQQVTAIRRIVFDK